MTWTDLLRSLPLSLVFFYLFLYLPQGIFSFSSPSSQLFVLLSCDDMLSMVLKAGVSRWLCNTLKLDGSDRAQQVPETEAGMLKMVNNTVNLGYHLISRVCMLVDLIYKRVPSRDASRIPQLIRMRLFKAWSSLCFNKTIHHIILILINSQTYALDQCLIVSK